MKEKKITFLFVAIIGILTIALQSCNDNGSDGFPPEPTNNTSIIGTWELIESDIYNSVGRQFTFYENGKVDGVPIDTNTNWYPYSTYTIRDDSLFCIVNDYIAIGYTFKFSADYNLLYVKLFNARNCDTCNYNLVLRVPYWVTSGTFRRVR